MSLNLKEGVSLPLPVDRTCFIFDQNFGKKEAQPTKSSIENFLTKCNTLKFWFYNKTFKRPKRYFKKDFIWKVFFQNSVIMVV